MHNELTGSEHMSKKGLFEGKEIPFPNKETSMTSIVDSSVSIHTSAELAPCSLPWFGEVVLLVAPLKTQRVLAKLGDLLSRPFPANSPNSTDKQTAGLVDRAGNKWTIFAVDGTPEAARQRGLPQTEDLLPP